MSTPKKFSRFLTWTLVIFQAVSLALIMTIVYSIFAGSMDEEFYQGQKARQGQAGMVLRDRLGTLKSQLKDLSLNNSMRVSLMLGVMTQAEDLMVKHYPPSQGASFFLRKWGSSLYIPPLSPELKHIKPYLARLSMEDAYMGLGFQNPRPGEVIYLDSMPIKRKTDVLGAAFVYYRPTEDHALWKRLQIQAGSHLYMVCERGLMSLRTGRVIQTPAQLRASIAGGEPARLQKELALATGFTPLTGFSRLWYHESTAPLAGRKSELALTLVLVSAGIFGMTLLMVVHIARKVSLPLQIMGAQAQEIAKEPRGRRLTNDVTFYSEFRQLAQAFNLVLQSLNSAQRELKSRVQRQLDASERRYRTLVETSPAGIMFVDEDGKTIYVNPAYLEITGCSQQEAYEIQPWSMVPLDEDARFREPWPWWLGREDQTGFETRLLRADGSTIWVEVKATRLWEDQGAGLLINLVDFSERKLAEDALKANEAQFRSLVENVLYGLVMYQHPSGRLIYLNPKAAEMLGYSPDELAECSVWDIWAPEEHAILKARLETKASGSLSSAATRNYTLIRKDGSRFQADTCEAPVIYQGNMVIQVVLTDLTERDLLQKQLQHAQKMEAVGTLAGGVAHEFNNILMAIRGYSQLLSMNRKLDPEVSATLEKINQSSRRASGLTTKMLSFSRLETGDKEPVDINQLLTGVLALLSGSLPRRIKLTRELAEDIPLIQANAGQLEQVLLNLAVNARDAMPDAGGEITFSTKILEPDEQFCLTNPWASLEPFLVLEVKDNGSGIPASVLERIFEPFFTTKDPGKGTGLGLSIAYSMIKGHGGGLLAQSQPGQGSCFRIYLPAHADRLTIRAEAKPAPLPEMGHGEFILVVDDEKPVREVTSQALTAGGYRIKEAANGEEALNIFAQAQASGEAFSLVIMDLSMPVMGGRECFARLLERYPAARIIVATGHGMENPEDLVIKEQARGVLNKPFDLMTMLNLVRDVLNQP